MYKCPSFEERQKQYAAFISELKLALPPAQVILDKKKLARHGRDESHFDPVTPFCAVVARSTEDVVKTVRLAAKHKVPMTPRGAGTGLEGASIPWVGGLVIDTSKLLSIRFDEANACAWVGAGVKKLALNRAANEKGFLFGPDPASNPCVGGMVSTSGSGMSTLRYGTTRENVIALRVVTPDGELVQTRQVVRKSSAGLELTQLYIGSEGTLGVVCEVCFRLFPLTKYNAGGYAAFETTEDAVRAVVAMKQRGVPETLLRCEMLNAPCVDASNKYSKTSLPVLATLLLEFTGNDKWCRDLKRDYKKVEKIFREVSKVRTMRYLKPGKDTEAAWDARRMCHFAAMFARSKKPEKVFGTDICVPIDKLTDIVKFTEDEYAKAKKGCYLCAHIADGNFHLIIPYADDKELKELQAIEEKMIAKAISMGGTITGEHGIGVGKVHHCEEEHGKAHVAIQERIKAALDKDNLMNPGVFYPHQQRLYPTSGHTPTPSHL